MKLGDYLSDNASQRVKIFSKNAGAIRKIFSGISSESAEVLAQYVNCTTTEIIPCGSNSALIYIDEKNIGMNYPKVDQLKFI